MYGLTLCEIYSHSSFKVVINLPVTPFQRDPNRALFNGPKTPLLSRACVEGIQDVISSTTRTWTGIKGTINCRYSLQKSGTAGRIARLLLTLVIYFARLLGILGILCTCLDLKCFSPYKLILYLYKGFEHHTSTLACRKVIIKICIERTVVLRSYERISREKVDSSCASLCQSLFELNTKSRRNKNFCGRDYKRLNGSIPTVNETFVPSTVQQLLRITSSYLLIFLVWCITCIASNNIYLVVVFRVTKNHSLIKNRNYRQGMVICTHYFTCTLVLFVCYWSPRAINCHCIRFIV